MYKRKYTTVLYIRIEQYIAFVRTLRRCPNYEFVRIKMSYEQCKDGLEMFYFGKIFQQELDKMKLTNY